MKHTSRGFLSTDFLLIAALLKQLRSLLCVCISALLSTKISLNKKQHP
ncbi:MAG: hypothetical protein H0A75_03165 [Candidatus Methanofishera endochildressiae]|uniref:Uncharacterized protein n=1 Tax=Candidatus Methanofishera endochildressiae TaxID=2738884 RepID=A0A7Z0SDJ8_9GAMM|nr:hypothetical protein [Candidatus Methanofishera endochildressiae]